MTDKLPELPKPSRAAVYATSANTDSVRKGFEMGGYEKEPALFTEDQLLAFAEEAVRLERERTEAIRHAGAMLSNCAFNLKQRTPGTILTAEDISALRHSQEAWDAAIRARSEL